MGSNQSDEKDSNPSEQEKTVTSTPKNATCTTGGRRRTRRTRRKRSMKRRHCSHRHKRSWRHKQSRRR